MNNLFLHSIIITVICFLFSLFYYDILFKHLISHDLFADNKKKWIDYSHNLWISMSTLFSLFASALIYATFGMLINLFTIDQKFVPILVSSLFWVLFTSNTLFIAVRLRQPVNTTFLNILFWLLILTIYSFYFQATLANTNLTFY